MCTVSTNKNDLISRNSQSLQQKNLRRPGRKSGRTYRRGRGEGVDNQVRDPGRPHMDAGGEIIEFVL